MYVLRLTITYWAKPRKYWVFNCCKKSKQKKCIKNAIMTRKVIHQLLYRDCRRLAIWGASRPQDRHWTPLTRDASAGRSKRAKRGRYSIVVSSQDAEKKISGMCRTRRPRFIGYSHKRNDRTATAQTLQLALHLYGALTMPSVAMPRRLVLSKTTKHNEVKKWK